jgi:glycosyltransferase involved in cell wall biosynthesis
MTTKNRQGLLKLTLESLKKSTSKNQYRLTVICDGDYSVTNHVLNDFTDIVDHILISRENLGLGPSINQGLTYVDSLKRWDSSIDQLTCYIQDDVIFKQGWLEKLSGKFLQLQVPLNLGFASGHSAIEHKQDPRAETHELAQGMYTNKYIRATCMLAMHNYWMSMWPIPKIDPETNQVRGRPNDGLGSGVDWHFVRVHQNSVCKTGKTNLIIPGLVLHNGFKESTWLKRELPESDSDKKEML